MVFYEVRQYKVLPGKMEAWLRLMDGEFIPFAVKQGMNITASLRGADETVYGWMRRFESEAERERLDAAVYESDFVKNIGQSVTVVINKNRAPAQRFCFRESRLSAWKKNKGARMMG